MSDPRDLRILLCHALRGIDDHEDYIRPFHSGHCADDAVAFQFFLDLVLSSEPCGIDKDILSSVVHDLCVHCISGGACNIGDDHPVLPEKTIDDRRFSHIGLSHDGDAGTVVLLVLSGPFRKMCSHCIKHISKSEPGRR